MINERLFEKFYKMTKYDLTGYFNDVLTFMQTDYVQIQQFYQGSITKINSSCFKNFTTIQNETSNVFLLFQKASNQMQNIDWWNLVEQFENIDNRLKTLQNINRWARSSIAIVGYSPNPQLNIVLNKNGTLERLSQDVLGSATPQNDWVQIALDNNLTEEKYTSNGGTKISVTLKNTPGSNFTINSVVDIIDGITVYGKDISSAINFIDDDLNVLSYKDTILQAIDILIKLKKNDNPDQPTIGLQSQLIIGQSQASLNFPVIIRQLNETFQTDDSLKNLTITAIRYEQDNMYVDFTVMSRLGEVIDKTSIL